QDVTRLSLCASLVIPYLLAVEHPQHAGIGGAVVLHRPGVRRHETVAGAAFVLRDFSSQRIRCRHTRTPHDAGKPHSTMIEAEAVSEKPLSPIHSNSNLPLSV